MRDKDFKADIFVDTAAAWTTKNPHLAQNDLGIESDTGKRKFGIGQRWSDTPYLALGAGVTGIVTLTQAAYDALAVQDAQTLYIITS